MGKEQGRRLTNAEKEAVQRTGKFWKDWMYLKESESEDYFFIVHKNHPTQVRRIQMIFPNLCITGSKSKGDLQ